MATEISVIIDKIVIDDSGATVGAAKVERAYKRVGSSADEAARATGTFAKGAARAGAAAGAVARDVASLSAQMLDLVEGLASMERAWMAFEVGVATAKRGATGFRQEIIENSLETAFFRGEVNKAAGALQALGAVTGLVGVGLSLKEMTDRATEYSNAMRILESTAGSEAEMVQRRLYDIGQTASTSATDLAALTKSMDTLDGGLYQTLNVVEGVALAMTSIPTSAEASAAALRQFTQAMQAGVLRGDEFQSVMEGSPGLVDALTKGLQRTAPELEATKKNLRSLAEAGELTSDRLASAFTSVLPLLRELAGSSERTLEQQAQRLENAITQFSGRVFERAGMSEAINRSFDDLIERFESLRGQNASVMVLEKLAVAADLAATAIFGITNNMGALLAVWGTWQVAKSTLALYLFIRGLEAGRTAMNLLAGAAAQAGPIMVASLRASGMAADTAAASVARLNATISSGLVKNVGALSTTAALGINPVGALVTLLGVAAAGWVAYASGASNAQKASMSMADTADMVRDGMAEASKTTANAAEAMGEFARASGEVAAQRAITNIEDQLENLEDATDKVTARMYAMGDIRTMGPMAADVAKLRLQFDRGTITIDEMREALAGLVKTDPEWRRRAEGVYEAADAYDKAEINVRRAEAALAAVKGEATAAQLALLGVGEALSSVPDGPSGGASFEVDTGEYNPDGDEAYQQRIASAEQANAAVITMHQDAMMARLDQTQQALMAEQIQYQEHMERLRELELEGASWTDVQEAKEALKQAHEARMGAIHQNRLDQERAAQARANGDLESLVQQHELRIAQMKGDTAREIELRYQQTMARIAQMAAEGADAETVAKARATAAIIKSIEMREAREAAAAAASVQNADKTAKAWEDAAARISGADATLNVSTSGSSSSSSSSSSSGGGKTIKVWDPVGYAWGQLAKFQAEQGQPVSVSKWEAGKVVAASGGQMRFATRGQIDKYFADRRQAIEDQKQAEKDIVAYQENLSDRVLREKGDDLGMLASEHAKTMKKIAEMEKAGANAGAIASAKATAKKLYDMKRLKIEKDKLENESKPNNIYPEGVWVNGQYLAFGTHQKAGQVVNGNDLSTMPGALDVQEVLKNMGGGLGSIGASLLALVKGGGASAGGLPSINGGAARYAEGGIAGHPPGTVPAFLERNTEAAVPLRSGRIPVEIRSRSGEGDSAAPARAVSVTLHVHGATDADSFRRSEGQIASRLARTLGRAAARHA